MKTGHPESIMIICMWKRGLMYWGSSEKFTSHRPVSEGDHKHLVQFLEVLVTSDIWLSPAVLKHGGGVCACMCVCVCLCVSVCICVCVYVCVCFQEQVDASTQVTNKWIKVMSSQSGPCPLGFHVTYLDKLKVKHTCLHSWQPKPFNCLRSLCFLTTSTYAKLSCPFFWGTLWHNEMTCCEGGLKIRSNTFSCNMFGVISVKEHKILFSPIFFRLPTDVEWWKTKTSLAFFFTSFPYPVTIIIQ